MNARDLITKFLFAVDRYNETWEGSKRDEREIFLVIVKDRLADLRAHVASEPADDLVHPEERFMIERDTAREEVRNLRLLILRLAEKLKHHEHEMTCDEYPRAMRPDYVFKGCTCGRNKLLAEAAEASKGAILGA